MGHVLWVTERCWREDLGLGGWPPNAPLSLGVHRAIDTLVGRRAQDPAPVGYEIGDTGGDLYKLRVGERHRGATWFDSDAGAVFLVAFDRHESGSDEDFYRRVPAAWRSGALRPSAADYEALRIARNALWIEDLKASVPDLGAEARTLARRGDATQPYAAGGHVLRLLAMEVEEQFWYAIHIESADNHPVDYARALLIASVVANALGLPSATPSSIWTFAGAPIARTCLAFDLG